MWFLFVERLCCPRGRMGDGERSVVWLCGQRGSCVEREKFSERKLFKMKQKRRLPSEGVCLLIFPQIEKPSPLTEKNFFQLLILWRHSFCNPGCRPGSWPLRLWKLSILYIEPGAWHFGSFGNQLSLKIPISTFHVLGPPESNQPAQYLYGHRDLNFYHHTCKANTVSTEPSLQTN